MTDAEQAPSAEDRASALQADTLRTDIRNLILTEFKHAPGSWPKLAESDQQRLISRAEDIAGTVVRRAIDIVAERGLPSLPVEVGKFKVDGSAVKAEIACHADDESLVRMRHLQGSRAVLVLASPDRFSAKGAEPDPEPDNVGDLALPKGDDSRADSDHLAKVGTGKPRRKNAKPDPEADAQTLAAEGVPSTAQNEADTSDPAFQVSEDA